ncbi:hypothetical protein L1987_80749 [Smallanthus sonchifolius]|uniref:Uncharacterized protein n=1 Tax=Smallanthus sonchifolius TaxID=185202 RepID=A0ACB8YMT7_9ASTR|nr:hypothetical protein L1987_80749 [Smallanthus sonchifolius]
MLAVNGTNSYAWRLFGLPLLCFAGAVAVFAAGSFILDFALSAADTFAADAVVFYFALSAAETFAAEGFAFGFLDFTLSAAILFAADGLNTDERFAIWLKGLNLHVAAKWFDSPHMMQVC